MQRKLLTRRDVLRTLERSRRLVAGGVQPARPAAGGHAAPWWRPKASSTTATVRQPTATLTRTGATSMPAASTMTPQVTEPPGAADATTSASATLTPTMPDVVQLPANLTVAVDDDVPSPLQAVAATQRDHLAQTLNATTSATSGDADLVIALSATPDGISAGPVVEIEYVAIVSRRLLVRDITTQQLNDIWNGAVDDWSTLGSPDPYSVTRLTLGGSAGPLPAEQATANVDSLDELAQLFIQDRGAIAIIPLAQLDFRFRALDLDGVNMLRRGDAPIHCRSPSVCAHATR